MIRLISDPLAGGSNKKPGGHRCRPGHISKKKRD